MFLNHGRVIRVLLYPCLKQATLAVVLWISGEQRPPQDIHGHLLCVLVLPAGSQLPANVQAYLGRAGLPVLWGLWKPCDMYEASR